MASPHLTLQGVSHVLPDGRTLFSDLHEQFDACPTGLVGRNGAGKTVLARMLAGQIMPTTGRVLRTGRVHYLPQFIAREPSSTVAELAGMQATLDALVRIEAGSVAPEDFDLVDDRWQLRKQLDAALADHGLGYLDASSSTDRLSGGEAMRVALIGAMVSAADFLILDEPTNHLDRGSRNALLEYLRTWPGGLIVISHDRELLATLPRIVELSSTGLQRFGGNYDFYAQAKAAQQQQAADQLDRQKTERKRQQNAFQQQRERQEKRQARGKHQAREANQASILLDRQRGRSEASTGKLQRHHAAARTQLNEQVRDAAARIDNQADIHLHDLPISAAHGQAAMLDDVTLPGLTGPLQHVTLTLNAGHRLGIVGPNGCGKSTLLKVLAGLVRPSDGQITVRGPTVYLDQHLSHLDPQQTVLRQAQAANANLPESEWRMRLAHLGLDAVKIMAPSHALSGGERLKGLLACVLYADPPPQLLLLDEPSNHLDLPSTRALEDMLRGYSGALVVVSHDMVFMDQLALTERLEATTEGWRMATWKD